jgi:hypothetical protein
VSLSFLLTTAVLATLALSGCGGDSSRTSGPTSSIPQSPGAASTADGDDVPATAKPELRVNQNDQSPVIKGWVAVRSRTTVVLTLDTYDPQGDLNGRIRYNSPVETL